MIHNPRLCARVLAVMGGVLFGLALAIGSNEPYRQELEADARSWRTRPTVNGAHPDSVMADAAT